MRDRFGDLMMDESRRREPAPGSFTGAAGGAACGDLARISLEIESGTVTGVTFDTEGCGAMRAATACVAEIAEGVTLLEAASIDRYRIDTELGGLTPAKMHAAILASDALHRAISAVASSDEAIAPSPSRGRRVLVAMSGGVDSSVAALIERDSGADVVAVTLKLWSDPDTDGEKACCSPEAVIGARRLSHGLGIPHLTLDLEDSFREGVVKPFLDGYAAGETPNPCILCNGEVRIAAMVRLADRLGAEALVTGHYARVVEGDDGPVLASAADRAKDQGYMLAGLPRSLLSKLRFPLGGMSKPEVRERAERAGLPVARKPESQDLCFLAGQGKRNFLRRHGGLADRPGKVRDRTGRVLGEHRGHHHFTVGQRRGIGVSARDPLYVLELDAARNEVVVGRREELGCDRVSIRDAVLHRDASRVDSVKLRYRTSAIPAAVSGARVPAGRYPSLDLDLGETFHGVAPGQTAVLYGGEEIVGHGTIAVPTK